MDVHLDHAAPDLDAAALRGTFYVTGGSQSVWNRMDEWRGLARRGHEIGNHSLNHPCTRVLPDGAVREWLWPERALESYTVRQMANELRVANILFTALDGRRERTYAYTCTDEVTGGGDSYVDAIKPLFPAGRDPNFTPVPDGRDGPVTDMRALDLYRVPSWMVIDVSGDEMIAYIERAARAGGMAVIMFHGVGGGHSLNVSREAHRQVLRFLDENRDRLWTDTFLAVMKHVRAERVRLGWDPPQP